MGEVDRGPLPGQAEDVDDRVGLFGRDAVLQLGLAGVGVGGDPLQLARMSRGGSTWSTLPSRAAARGMLG